MTRHGLPLGERLKAGMVVNENGCWIWQKGTQWGKYGWMRVKETKERATHRLAYIEWVGPIPDGFDVDHECHNRAAEAGLCLNAMTCIHKLCINPNHLKAKSRAGNLKASPVWRQSVGYKELV